MKDIKRVLAIAAISAVFLVQSGWSTVLTFDVRDSNTYIGNEQIIPDTYGTAAIRINMPNGVNQIGNGWTPNVSMHYAAKGSSRLLAAGGGGGAGTVYINLNNAGFETPDQGGQQRVANWIADSDFTAYPINGASWAHSGSQALQLWNYVGLRQNTGQTVLPNTTYNLTLYARKFPSDPYGTNYIQLWGGDVFSGGTEIGSDFDLGTLTDTYQSLTLTATTGASGPEIGQNLWVRIRHEGASAFVLIDDVQLSYPASYGSWDKVAKLSWTNLSDATWDFVFTPDRGYGVVLNSFILEPVGSETGNSGIWTVYRNNENGVVVASGSWTNLTAYQTVNVNNAAGSGPLMLRLTVTSGGIGRMAVDSINFDQVMLACDNGYQQALDLVPDCVINLKDLAVIAATWSQCNNPADAACLTKTWPK